MASRHLLNPLAPLDQPTPSALDGVPPTLERDLRACECRLCIWSRLCGRY